MNFFPKNKLRGFTLMELLVVIAMIGLLSSVVLVNLSTVKVKSRDARRIADLASLELAIVSYYDSNNGTFPNNDGTWNGDWSAAYKEQLAPYISQLPVDPLANHWGRYYGSMQMTWAPDASCNLQYVLWTYIEGNNTGANTCGFGGPHYFRVLGRY